jgi:hypothetical protein
LLAIAVALIGLAAAGVSADRVAGLPAATATVVGHEGGSTELLFATAVHRHRTIGTQADSFSGIDAGDQVRVH